MKIKDLEVRTPQGPAGDLRHRSQYEFNARTDNPACAITLATTPENRWRRGNTLPPVFAMSMPEGYLLYKIYRQHAKVELVDDMRLLHLTGRHTIGRMTFSQPEETTVPFAATVGLDRLIHESASRAMFKHLVNDYLYAGISGAQPKVVLPDADHPVVDRTMALQSNLIVKTGETDTDHLAWNEYVCMDAARRAGLDVPNFWLSDDAQLFIIERFDLNGGTQHGFEDMTVVLGQAREPTGRYKYQWSYEKVAEAIKRFCGTNAVASAQAFFEYFVLCVAVRNGDAHLKNFGLLYEHPAAAEAPCLAPLYDVVTTAAYDDYNSRTQRMFTDRTLALKLNKSKSYPTREELIAFGKQYCYVKKPEEVIERVGDGMSAALHAHHDRVPKAFYERLRSEWETGLGTLGPTMVYIDTASPALPDDEPAMPTP